MIVDPSLTEEEVTQRQSQIQESFGGLGGEVLSVENWGKRRLAFEIRKHREGTYLLFEAQAEPPVIKEFERQLRLNESILRFMSTRVAERRRRADVMAAPSEPAPADPASGSEPRVEEVG